MELLALLVLGGLVGAVLAAYASVRFGPRVQRLLPAAWLRSALFAIGVEYQPTWGGVERLILKRMEPVLGLDGVRTVPVRYEVRLAPEDYAVAGDRVALMEVELVKALRRRAHAQRWQWPKAPQVVITVDPDVVEGFPEVRFYLDSSLEGSRQVDNDPVHAWSESRSASGESATPKTSRPSQGPTIVSGDGLPTPTVRAGVYDAVLESPSGDSHSLVILDEDSSVLVGRHVEAEVNLDSPYVSGRHAKVRYDSVVGEALVEDLGSTNGTLVDGRAIIGPTHLPAGSLVRFGRGGPEFVLRRQR